MHGDAERLLTPDKVIRLVGGELEDFLIFLGVELGVCVGVFCREFVEHVLECDSSS